MCNIYILLLNLNRPLSVTDLNDHIVTESESFQRLFRHGLADYSSVTGFLERGDQGIRR